MVKFNVFGSNFKITFMNYMLNSPDTVESKLLTLNTLIEKCNPEEDIRYKIPLKFLLATKEIYLEKMKNYISS